MAQNLPREILVHDCLYPGDPMSQGIDNNGIDMLDKQLVQADNK